MSALLDPPLRRAETTKASPWRLLGLPPDLLICAGLVTAVLLVQAWNIAGYPTVSDDEGTYLAQAWALQHGIGLAPYTYWYDHPPFGWMQIAALSWIPALIFHGHQLVAAYARIIMVPVTAVSAILVYVLARRLPLPRWAAGLAVVLFGLSPLSVTLQREIFLDNFAVPWILAAFVLAYSRRQHLWHHVASGACAALGVLSKETMIIVVPALVVALWRNAHRATRKYSFAGFLAAFFLVGAQYPLYAVLKGELFEGYKHVSLLGGLMYQIERPGSGSIFAAGSGSSAIVHSWLYYDPVLLYAGAAATVLALAFRHLRPVAIAAALLALVAMRPSGYLPAMYVIGVLPFFALVLAGMADRLAAFLLRFRARPVRWERAARLAVAAVAAAAAAAYVVPRWYTGDRTADVADPNAGYQAAVTWIAANLRPASQSRIVVDDAMWADVVADGFKPGRGAIWFFKVDLDPAIKASMPHGWRDINYIVSTPMIRQSMFDLPTVQAALGHSRVLASFGTGSSQIQVRQVVPGS